METKPLPPPPSHKIIMNASHTQDTLALLESSSIKDLINSFGVESVLLWNVMILKKRIVIIDDSLPRMFRLIRTLPQLVWHRQSWNLLRPLCTLSDKEITELQTSGIYVAGFLDPLIRSSQDLWDVLIDGTDCSITIADHSAKGEGHAFVHSVRSGTYPTNNVLPFSSTPMLQMI